MLATTALICGASLGAAPTVAAMTHDSRTGSAGRAHHLDLGPADLQETRTSTHLEPGVTLTRITRGASDPALQWTLETQIPATSGSPDPDAPPRAISDRPSARTTAERLRAKGFPARVERVRRPATADVAAGTLGFRVRVGSYQTKQEADAENARLAASDETATSVYTGWDGDASARGPWHVNVVTINPHAFRGTLGASYGPDLYRRETTSDLSRAAGATVGVNAGFFVLDPAAGAPGDPAGVGVYDGHLLSEPVNGRPTLVLHRDGADTTVRRFSWQGTVAVGGRNLPLDGVDRVPGLIRNCGGDRTDQPTSRPLHDITCTDDGELVAFTPQYAASTPSGAGREVVVDRHGVVRSVSDSRGVALSRGLSSVQGTGSMADALAPLQVGDKLPLRMHLTSRGHEVPTPRNATVVNGGPLLLRHGREHITQRRDGFVHPGDPSFAYGWFVKRNPRTFAGVDSRGCTVLVTVDGRGTDDLGLSIPETADVARSLGLEEAVNLDGGGSTTMAIRGRVISHPSDASGERPVGDALLVAPR